MGCRSGHRTCCTSSAGKTGSPQDREVNYAQEQNRLGGRGKMPQLREEAGSGQDHAGLHAPRRHEEGKVQLGDCMPHAKVSKKTTLWLGSDDDELEDGA